MVQCVVCPAGFYGRNCADRCSAHCHIPASGAACFRNGTCVDGCETGWISQNCNTGTPHSFL